MADTHFSLLNLEPVFNLNLDALEQNWRAASAQVHPDRFATASAAEKRIAMQWASNINQAYQVLRKPVSRAAYICQLAGQDLEAESNTRMDPEFLMKQMQWREELDDARGNDSALAALRQEVLREQTTLENEIGSLLDESKDYSQAVDKVRQLMFLVKMQDEMK